MQGQYATCWTSCMNLSSAIPLLQVESRTRRGTRDEDENATAVEAENGVPDEGANETSMKECLPVCRYGRGNEGIWVGWDVLEDDSRCRTRVPSLSCLCDALSLLNDGQQLLAWVLSFQESRCASRGLPPRCCRFGCGLGVPQGWRDSQMKMPQQHQTTSVANGRAISELTVAEKREERERVCVCVGERLKEREE